ncbi:hypothetical protein IMZ48_29040, partial [Candidatus Bathyarchaeota archaeon]|nr:hypothetical protein [Candidatus Bathyarchaeota archaeon]
MTQAAGIPHYLWRYAVRTAVAVINLLPTSANEGSISPHEALYRYLPIPDKKPYIKHLRTFGCTAYVHRKGALRPNRADKMQPRAIKGKLVGYDSLHGHLYFVWCPSTDQVYRVRDVRFREERDNPDRPPP